MLKKLTDRIYYMPHCQDGDRPVLGLVSGSKYSMIIDSGNSPRHAKEFLNSLKDLDIAPVKYLVLTHYHWDHVFGIKDMNLITIANEKTKEEVEKLKKLKWNDESLKEYIENKTFTEFTVQCIKAEIHDRENFEIGSIDITYKNNLEIDLGGINCLIRLVKNPHTDDSVIIYIPEEKTLFLGDCLYGRTYKDLYIYDKDTLFNLIETIESYEAENYIISHEPLFSRTQIMDLWNDFKMASDAVGDSRNSEESINNFIKLYDKKPSGDIDLYINCFVNANKTHS